MARCGLGDAVRHKGSHTGLRCLLNNIATIRAVKDHSANRIRHNQQLMQSNPPFIAATTARIAASPAIKLGRRMYPMLSSEVG